MFLHFFSVPWRCFLRRSYEEWCPLYGLQVEAVPRSQLRRQFPPRRLHECVHSNNALWTGEQTCPREQDITGKDAILHSCESQHLRWLIHVYCLNFCYLIVVYQNIHQFVLLKYRFSISYPSPCHLTYSAQRSCSDRIRIMCSAIAAPRALECFREKIALLVRKTDYLVTFMRIYMNRDNWNYVWLNGYFLAWFKRLPRYKAKRCQLSSAPIHFKYKL